MDNVTLAALILRLSWHTSIPFGAVPGAIRQWRDMGAGTAIDLLGGFRSVAEVMRCTHLALKPCGICADGRWQSVSKRQPLTLSYSLFGMIFVILYALCIDAVIVLADGYI
tara:strand:+ start:1034 stop:1366 length:333 start_codon:yes stop_codon:yes gene_type:complete